MTTKLGRMVTYGQKTGQTSNLGQGNRKFKVKSSRSCDLLIM